MQQRDIAGPAAMIRDRRGRRSHRTQFIWRRHLAQARHQPGENSRYQTRRIESDQCRGFAVLQDAGLAAQMILDLARPRRWINRYRHRAGEQDAVKTVEEFESSRQHQGHALAAANANLAQTGGDLPRGRQQLPVA